MRNSGGLVVLGLSMAAAFGAGACVDESISTDDDVALKEREIDPAKELMITDPSVIRDSYYTTFDPAQPSGSHGRGAWSFGRLVHNMLPAAERTSAAAASQLVLRWLATWETDQAPSPTVSPARARPSIRQLITTPWKTASGCAHPASPETDADCVLDMRVAPFALMAIANRPDLRIVSSDGRAIGGEGRFVFQVVGPTLGVDATSRQIAVMDPSVKPQKFTVIFEYSLPVDHAHKTLHWAHRWHALGALPFGAQFNRELERITTDFASADADLRRANGNALNQIRTNEVALMGARFPTTGFTAAKQFWELREFVLAEDGLHPHTVNLEPSRDFDITRAAYTGLEGTRSAELITFLETNTDAVVAGKHVLPAGFSGNSALVGSAPYGAWGKAASTPPGQPHQLGGASVAARDSFALSTCAGCHRHETDTRHFMHVTLVGAMEPTSAVDDRARIGADTKPDDAVVLSNVLAADLAPGGGRFEDFRALLETQPIDLMDRPGRRTH